jgi:hypothetical protein
MDHFAIQNSDEYVSTDSQPRTERWYWTDDTVVSDLMLNQEGRPQSRHLFSGKLHTAREKEGMLVSL